MQGFQNDSRAAREAQGVLPAVAAERAGHSRETLTCWPCIDYRHGDRCARGGAAVRRCERYEYEPGSDEAERNG